MSGLFHLVSSLADPTLELRTPGHLHSLGQHTPDPELALRSFHSTLTGHFSAGGGSMGPRSRIEYATHLAMAFFEPHLTEAKAYFDAVTHDLTPVFPHLVPVDYAARVVAETECRASQLLVPWCGPGNGGSALPPALALESSLGMALAGVAPPARVALVLRAALVATACACSRDFVAGAEAWTFPYDPPVSYGGPSEEELDVRRDLLLRDILAAASGAPLGRRLLPAVAALTGRQLIAILGRSKCTSFTAMGIPNSSLPHSAQSALVERLPHVPKPYPLYVSLVPWVARNSGHEQHAYTMHGLDDAAYFAACSYPVCMYRVCDQAVTTFMVSAQERRRERVRRRDAEDEGDRELVDEASRTGEDGMMVDAGPSEEAAARMAATGNPFGFVPSVLSSAALSRAGSAPGTPENGRKRVRTLQPDEH